MTRFKKIHWFKKILLGLLLIFILGFFIPQTFALPIRNATEDSYDQKSYWFYPWGKSVTHKGVDIFAKKGTPVYPATAGIVLFSGKTKIGGNVVYILGPKWRVHYYAHLDSINKNLPLKVSSTTQIGTVGTTGNAAGKPPHLHYTIKSIIPYPWKYDKGIQGWRRMFYINPIPYLNEKVRRSEVGGRRSETNTPNI